MSVEDSQPALSDSFALGISSGAAACILHNELTRRNAGPEACRLRAT